MVRQRASKHYLLILVSILSVLGFAYLAGVPADAMATVVRVPQPTAHLPGSIGPAFGKHVIAGPHSARSGSAFSNNAETASSENWSGYVVTSLGASTTAFTGVQAEWTQPAVTCDPRQTFQDATFWVGLDGWESDSVEQGGSWAICNNGTPSYSLFWEMFPGSGQITVTVSPGDIIKASVTYDPTTSDFDIVVSDLTSGAGISQVEPCGSLQDGCVRSSAEVIAEDPAGGNDLGGLLPLAPYGTNTFTDASVTDDTGHNGTLNDAAWQTLQVNEVSLEDVTMQSTSALSPDGSSFTPTWENANGGALVAEYMTGNTAPGATEIEPNIQLLNTSDVPIPLFDVTIRYWFTEDGTEPLEYACDFAVVGCSNISSTFVQVSPAVTGADNYLQIGFSSVSGNIPVDGSGGQIQNRFWQEDFTNMTQTNDYSFNANDTSYTANPDITVYVNGQIVYGFEP